MDTDTLHLVSRLVVRPLLYAALIACAFAPLEQLIPLRQQGPSTRAGTRIDVCFMTLGAIVAESLQYLVAGGLLALGEWLGAGAGSAQSGLLSALSLRSLPAPLAFVLSLLLFELAGYGYHRLAHRVPMLWRLHAVHHSATTMDWLASFRQHPLEIALMTAAQNLPLVLLGLPLGTHALLVVLLRVHTVFVHANLRTPSFLGRFIAMPTFHHRHHDRDAHDVNFASLFPWIDRAFGTFDPAPAGAPGPAAQSKITPQGNVALSTSPVI